MIMDALTFERLCAQLRDGVPSLLPQAERLALAASHDVTVLLTGETGTGKTHLARLIHACSPRREERLLVVPCGALAPALVESEFFGHARGAFTGAGRAKEGKLQAVGRGTLLLDEIDALGLEQQAKLLRVLETSEFEPVGSNETRTCEARVIAASNRNLDEAMAAGQFRADLYHRLSVLALVLPPLRERPEDIACLAGRFAARFGAAFHGRALGVRPETLEVLLAYTWPGNIRQLEIAVQQAALRSCGADLGVEHLPECVRRPVAPATPAPAGPLRESRRAADRTLIEETLRAQGHHRGRTARALGISKAALSHYLKAFGLQDTRAPPQAWANRQERRRPVLLESEAHYPGRASGLSGMLAPHSPHAGHGSEAARDYPGAGPVGGPFP
jgi:transcriptional regulator with PAS, ATPase and Fis domain